MQKIEREPIFFWMSEEEKRLIRTLNIMIDDYNKQVEEHVQILDDDQWRKFVDTVQK